MLTDTLPAETTTSPLSVLLLAVVQGLAEFLPISSSGHLVLARVALEVRKAGLALDVALHVGTLLAVLCAYRREVGELLRDLAAGRLRMWGWLLLATVPVGVVGLSLQGVIEEAAHKSSVAAAGLLVTAALLLAGEWGRGRQGEGAGGDAAEAPGYGRPRFADALWLGCAQALAIVPGISRSGSTIAVGLLRGLPAGQAARLSFLMSLPAVSGAAIVKLPEAFRGEAGAPSAGLVLLAVGISALVGWAALRVLLIVLKRGAFPWFAGYCALLATAALVFL